MQRHRQRRRDRSPRGDPKGRRYTPKRFRGSEEKDPLLVFIGDRLNEATGFKPVLAGIFKRVEEKTASKRQDELNYGKSSQNAGNCAWIAKKSLEVFDGHGFDRQKLYDVSTLQGGAILKSHLKSAIFNGDVGNDSKIVHQLFRVINLIVKYFTDEDLEPDPEIVPEIDPEIVPEPEIAFNPWNQVESEFESEIESSFVKIKDVFARDLAKMGSRDPFEMAAEMTNLFASVRHTFLSLKSLVLKSESEAFAILFPRLEKARKNGSRLTKVQVEQLLKRTINYIIRGEREQPSKNAVVAAPSADIVLNYIPLGLREQEELNARLKNKEVVLPEEVEMARQHPLAETSGNLGMKKYLVGSVWMDWLTIDGVSHVTEISIHFPHIADLELYIVDRDTSMLPKEMLLKANLVLNTEKSKFYHVRGGLYEAGSIKFTMKKLTGFLESMRNAEGENSNHGLILAFRGFEEVCLLSKLFEMSQSSAILKDVVQGYGMLETMVNGCSRILRPTFADDVFKITVENRTLISKSKSELLNQLLELHVGSPDLNFKNFVKPYCIPSSGHQLEELKAKYKGLDQFYKLEAFLISRIKGDPDFKPLDFEDYRCQSLQEPIDKFCYRLSKIFINNDIDVKYLVNKFNGSEDYNPSTDVEVTGSMSKEDKQTLKHAKPLYTHMKSFFNNYKSF